MRILALDLGERRVGVAVSDPSETLARPVGTIQRSSRAEDVQRILALIDEHRAELVVVGLPLSLSGEVGPQARWVLRYVELLQQSLPVPVVTWDERYTSSAAEDLLRTSRSRRERRAGDVDAVAAALILQSYLDARAENQPGPEAESGS